MFVPGLEQAFNKGHCLVITSQHTLQMTPVEFAIPMVESVTLLVVRTSLLVVHTPLWVERVTMLGVPASLLTVGALLLVVCAPLSGLCTVSADSVRKAIEARELASQTVHLLVGLEDDPSAANM